MECPFNFIGRDHPLNTPPLLHHHLHFHFHEIDFQFQVFSLSFVIQLLQCTIPPRPRHLRDQKSGFSKGAESPPERPEEA